MVKRMEWKALAFNGQMNGVKIHHIEASAISDG